MAPGSRLRPTPRSRICSPSVPWGTRNPYIQLRMDSFPRPRRAAGVGGRSRRPHPCTCVHLRIAAGSLTLSCTQNRGRDHCRDRSMACHFQDRRRQGGRRFRRRREGRRREGRRREGRHHHQAAGNWKGRSPPPHRTRRSRHHRDLEVATAIIEREPDEPEDVQSCGSQVR